MFLIIPPITDSVKRQIKKNLNFFFSIPIMLFSPQWAALAAGAFMRIPFPLQFLSLSLYLYHYHSLYHYHCLHFFFKGGTFFYSRGVFFNFLPPCTVCFQLNSFICMYSLCLIPLFFTVCCSFSCCYGYNSPLYGSKYPDAITCVSSSSLCVNFASVSPFMLTISK